MIVETFQAPPECHQLGVVDLVAADPVLEGAHDSALPVDLLGEVLRRHELHGLHCLAALRFLACLKMDLACDISFVTTLLGA